MKDFDYDFGSNEASRGVRWVSSLELYLRPISRIVVIEGCPSLAETREFSRAISGRIAKTAHLTEGEIGCSSSDLPQLSI